MNETVEYDSEADVLYLRLSPGEQVQRTIALDDSRLIDYSADGAVLGLEFIDASQGVDLRDLPFAQKAEQIIRDSGLDLPVFA